jgi:hypothetical protein
MQRRGAGAVGEVGADPRVAEQEPEEREVPRPRDDVERGQIFAVRARRTFWAFTSIAPWERSIAAISRFPLSAAKCNGVDCEPSRQFTSMPSFERSKRATSAF